MKERILKLGVSLVLVAVLVAAVVCPITSQAAAKGTTYNVVLEKGSGNVLIASLGGGAPAVQQGDSTGITFQMVVDSKAKTEKVKSTGQKATYYQVIIPKKSWNAPTTSMLMPGGDTSITTTTLKKDAKGKLYSTAGGDVDVNRVWA